MKREQTGEEGVEGGDPESGDARGSSDERMRGLPAEVNGIVVRGNTYTRVPECSRCVLSQTAITVQRRLESASRMRQAHYRRQCWHVLQRFPQLATPQWVAGHGGSCLRRCWLFQAIGMYAMAPVLAHQRLFVGGTEAPSMVLMVLGCWRRTIVQEKWPTGRCFRLLA